MMQKRIFFETREVSTVVKQGHVTLDKELLQCYDNVFFHLASISGSCAKDFMLWIMSKTDNENEFTYSRELFEQFNEDLSRIRVPKKYQQNTLDVAIKQLVKSDILIHKERGRYKVNPSLFSSKQLYSSE